MGVVWEWGYHYWGSLEFPLKHLPCFFPSKFGVKTFERKIQAQLAEIAELRAQLAKLPDLEVGDFLQAGPLSAVSRVK